MVFLGSGCTWEGKGKMNIHNWQEVLEKLKRDRNPLYDLYKDSQLIFGDELTLYFSTEEQKKKASEKRPKLQHKLPLHWQNKKLNLVVGTPPAQTATVSSSATITRPSNTSNTSPVQMLQSPLQALLFQKQPQTALEAAAKADRTCARLYQQLTEKTKQIADDVVTAKFSWRVRVGGIRGFHELLLPVFHPVYGVPYVPSSSLKGAVLAWARQHGQPKAKCDRLFGSLNDGIGCVQFLDAFPTRPCLSVDMANPQWSWKGDTVKYQPVPHALLSMAQPELLIGLGRTKRGNTADVQLVKEWLQQALGCGIGSRVSAGYGRTSLEAGFSHSSKHEFKLWTQGMYGADTNTPEFRPVALRGVLRYWFRAVAWGLYDINTCRDLEMQLFGTLSREGSIRIGVEWQENRGNRDHPHFYTGTILLESKVKDHLNLIEKVLQLCSHLGGIGRGSRRPLHRNNGRLRGCHWQLTEVLSAEKPEWQEFLETLRDSFLSVHRRRGTPPRGNPGKPGKRVQDVLNADARIYLVPSAKQLHPTKVNSWSKDGHKSFVLGSALKLLYSSNDFKGVNRQKQGNANVGGKFGTPSYVTIQSNFPPGGKPYQTVTIFGAGQRDRRAFETELPSDSIKVWPLK
jgi:CRISPR-associated protein Cmr6